MEEEEDNTLKISMNNFRERLFYIFYRYWENDQLTDLEFSCEDGEVVTCHKFMVVSASKFLREVIDPSPTPDDLRTVVHLPDVSAPTLRYILSVVYTGTAEMPEKDIDKVIRVIKMLKFDIGLGNMDETDEEDEEAQHDQAKTSANNEVLMDDPESLLAALTDEITVTSAPADNSIKDANLTNLYQSILNNFPPTPSAEQQNPFVLNNKNYSPQKDHKPPPGFVDRTRDFSCRLCGIELRRHNQLLDHFHVVHPNQKAFQCGICMHENSEYAAHQAHMATHDPSEEWPCPDPDCDKTFNNVPDMKAHRVECHGDDVMASGRSGYPCPDCPEEFNTLGAYRRHRTSHTGQRPYPCPTPGCDKGFHTRFHLSRHMRLHTGVKPFPCPLCPYRCNQKPNLRIHMRHKHKIEIPSSRRRGGDIGQPTVIENNIYIGASDIIQRVQQQQQQGFAVEALNYLGSDTGGNIMDADVSSTGPE